MIEIEFHDREKEIEEIMNVLQTRPDLITFIYGPINSGKTELITHVINSLPNEYVTFYINLRGRFIRDYDDFMRILFKFEKDGNLLKALADQSIKFLKFKGIPVSESILDLIFREKKGEDVFEFLEDYITKIAEKRKPVLIIDELQVIGDVEIDGKLIYRLFNFFVRLTKELHLCHVFTITSDSLFIEHVYSEAMLSDRADYLLVDDFNYETTVSFLKKYGFNDEEIKLVWHYFGGKPIRLVEVIKKRHKLKQYCESSLKLRKRQIKDALYSLKDRENVIELLKAFKDRDEITYEEITDEMRWCVKNNILFVDPQNEIVKPQSRLDLLAVRRVVEEVGSR